jgi:KAP family P-loop domain
MRAIHILARWSQLAVYAFIGSILVAYGGPRLQAWSEAQFETVTNGKDAALPILAGIMTIALVAVVHAFAKFRIQHIRWLSYPPLPFAIVAAFATAPLWPSFRQFGAPVARVDLAIGLGTAAAYAAIWLLLALTVAVAEQVKMYLGRGRGAWQGDSPRQVRDLSDDQIGEWIARERPIDGPSEDLFGFWDFSKRLLTRLARRGHTIVIQGGFGAGKTSLIRLLEQRAARDRLDFYFVQVSCWGFEDTIAAQKSVLSSLVRRLNDEVDCLSIRGLPREYVSIVGKRLEWLYLLSPIDETPLQQLQRLSPILNAIRRRIVVVVEDVDRAGQRFDIGSVFALLSQFREVDSLSFVLTISPHQSMDFAKLCEFSEIIPTPASSDVAAICQHVRDALVRKHADILVDKLDDLAGADRVGELTALIVPGTKLWTSAVIELLRSPRFLKRALRRLSEAWDTLHGEVSIDALLMTCTLREAAPAAFSFLQAELSDILAATRSATYGSDEKPYLKALREDLRARWKRVVARKEFDRRSVETVILNLFVGTSFLSNVETYPKELKQGPSGDRAELYAKRLLTEQLEVSQ